MPADLRLGRGLIFLWQQPSSSTLGRLEKDYFDMPILAGRFDAERALHDLNIPYHISADFFPLRTQMDFELASIEARASWSGEPEPAYEGMSLLDGDMVRQRVWKEMIAAVATLLIIRRDSPDTEIWTDWMGSQLVQAVGLKAKRLWLADLGDPNLPVRRWVRERLHRDAEPQRTMQSPEGRTADRLPPSGANPDIVFVIGSWVQQRQLDSFPIEAMADRGYRVAVWVHGWSAAMQRLTDRRSDIAIGQIDIPVAFARSSSLAHQISSWCHSAAVGGFFDPVRGELAQRMVRLMNWPRWAPKLVAMYDSMRVQLQATQPGLVIAPAEKDWTSYCAHHAARSLAIETVGIKHGTYLAGSYLERVNNNVYFPTAANRILAFSPDEVTQETFAPEVSADVQVWHGNPRLDKPGSRFSAEIADRTPRILICPSGITRDRAAMRWRHVVPLYVRFIDALYQRLGSSVRVRLHPLDTIEHYPSHLRSLFVETDTPLDEQMLEYPALATIYSTVARDAAAAGRLSFIWDADGLDLDRSDVAQQGAGVVSTKLGDICDAAERFVNDIDYRRALMTRAAEYPQYIQQSLPDPNNSPTCNLTGWLASLVDEPTSRRRQPAEVLASVC
jgi:hypothetical protein